MVLAVTQRFGLWLYAHALRSGVLGSRPGRWFFHRTYFAYKRYFEDPFLNLTRRHPELFLAGHILDVGANVGYTACVFADRLDPGFRVWAFEPSSDNFSRLRTILVEHRKTATVTPLHTAVGADVGQIDLKINELHPGDHRVHTTRATREAGSRFETIPLTSVDATVASKRIDPIAFIKIDVQGYELNVCRGMVNTVEANPWVSVAVEFSPSSLNDFGSDPAELLRFFSDRNYRTYHLRRRGSLRPIDGAGLTSLTSSAEYVDLLFVPASVRMHSLEA